MSNPRFLKGSSGLAWEVLQKCHTLCGVVEGPRENLNIAIDLFPLLQKELLVYQHEIITTTTTPYTLSTPWAFSHDLAIAV